MKRAPGLFLLLSVLITAFFLAPPGFIIFAYGQEQQVKKVDIKDTSDKEYILCIGDEIKVMVEGFPKISAMPGGGLGLSLEVDPQGYLLYPYIGSFKAAGMNLGQVEEKITEVLKERYKKPVVHVGLYKGYTKYVYITGKIGVPGQVEITRAEVPIMEVIAMGKGVKIGAAVDRVSIYRGGETRIYDLTGLIMRGEGEDIKVRAGDIINIPDRVSKSVAVTGEVKLPGILEIRDGATLMDAVIQAGNFTNEAKITNILLYRRNPGAEEIVLVDWRKIISDLYAGKNEIKGTRIYFNGEQVNQVVDNLVLEDRDIVHVPHLNAPSWDHITKGWWFLDFIRYWTSGNRRYY